MSGSAWSLSVLASPSAPAERQFMQGLLLDLLDAQGQVRFTSILAFHQHLMHRHRFLLVRNIPEGVRPGGRHLFYKHDNVLLRVKTTGTEHRKDPHITISLATGLDWSEELAKLSRGGDLVPKGSAIMRAGHRALRRLSDDFEVLMEMDDRWADSCHFNFVGGVDVSGALALPVP